MKIPATRWWAGLAVIVLALFAVARLPSFLCGSDQPVPSPALVVLAGGRYTLPRLVAGFDLLQRGTASSLVVTGVEYDPSHPAFDANSWALLCQHTNMVATIIDGQSRITRESVHYVVQLATEHKWTQVLVLTSDFHWRRTRAMFRHEADNLDVRVITVPSENFQEWWRVPYTRRLLINEFRYYLTYYAFHTWMGGVAVLLAAVALAGLVVCRR